jgi:hypothetical protein
VIAIILLAILVMGSLYALLSNVNTATAELQQTRDDATSVALRQAKEALIAWSATHMNGPGHLLCPDTDDDGEADTVTCGTAATRVGRLPWRTLALPDLRDGGGERLWYAVSRCFLERSTDQYCADNYAVNSDTQGQLMVQGIAPGSNIVAIIFAPGRALAGQNRSAATKNQVANYLEGENQSAPVAPCEYVGPFNAGTGKYDWCQDRFETRRRCEQSDCPGGPFNDQLIVITHADLFNVVENAVARRLETEIAALLRYYRDRWAALGTPGFFPFAVPAMSPGLPGGPPAASTFCGASPQAEGLLPATLACFTWNPGAATVTETGPPSGFFTGGACAAAPGGEPDAVRIAALKCTVTYTGGSPVVSISIPPLQNAGAALVVAEQGMVRFGTPADLPLPYSGAPWGALTTTGIAASDITVQYNGTLPAQPPGGPYTATITVPVYAAQTRYQQTAGVDTAWFFNNEWYRDTYYAVVPQRLPGAGGACTPGLNCLTVLNFPGIPDDKQAVIVLAGRSINGVARPTATLADYFEVENDEAAGPTVGTFERRLRSRTFNDKVVVVSP